MRIQFHTAVCICVALTALTASSDASAQDVQALKDKKDVPGLMRLLRHRDGKVRSSAAVALSGVIRQTSDGKKLARHVQPLIDSALRDPYSTVREYSGRSLQHCLQNITDASVLTAAAIPMVDSLHPTEVDGNRRRYCAVQLSRVIQQLPRSSLLDQFVPMLLTATLDDPDETVREYAGRALKSALPRVRDSKLMHTGTVALARTLGHKDVKRRRYAAVLLSWMVSRIKEVETLRAIAAPIQSAAERDSNEYVREYSGRAARDISRRLEADSAE